MFFSGGFLSLIDFKGGESDPRGPSHTTGSSEAAERSFQSSTQQLVIKLSMLAKGAPTALSLQQTEKM